MGAEREDDCASFRREVLTCVAPASYWPHTARFSLISGSGLLSTKEILCFSMPPTPTDCVLATGARNACALSRCVLASAHVPPRWRVPTLQSRAALNRQWWMYSMIVYFASLSVMDEDLCGFENVGEIWWGVERGGGSCFKNQLPQGEKRQQGL